MPGPVSRCVRDGDTLTALPGCSESLSRREPGSPSAASARFLVALLFLAMLRPAAAAAEINDEAFLFSATTVQRANSLIEQIRQSTNPPKEITVRTVPSMPSNDNDLRAMAERIFHQQRVTGVLILVVGKPPSLVLTSRNDTFSRIPDSAKIQSAMLADFRSQRFDAGLLGGLGALREELVKVFPLGKKATVPSSAKTAPTETVPKQSVALNSSPSPSVGSVSNRLHLSNTFFVLMFSVAAYMLFPWHYFGGKRYCFDRMRFFLRGLPQKLRQSRALRNVRGGSGPGKRPTQR